MALELLQTQLGIINELLKAAGSSYTKSEFFRSALRKLAALLNTDLLMHTSIYHDKNNNEYQLSHDRYIKQTDGERLVHTHAKLYDHDLPLLIDQLYQNKAELKVKATLLPAVYLGGFTLTDLGINDDENMVVVPFFGESSLLGLLAFKADEPVQLQRHFPAVFTTLETIFQNLNRDKNAQLAVATYQTVLDLMPQRVFWKNKKSVYLGCNKAFSDDATLAGPSDIIGVTDFDIFPDQAVLYRSDDANTMDTLEHLINSEEPQTHQDGTTIWLRTSKRPIIDAENHVVGVVGTYDDITQLKETQHQLEIAKTTLEHKVLERTQALSASNLQLESAFSELKQTQNQLIENEKMASLGALIAGISHEINTPLGVAVTSASHLAELAKTLSNVIEAGTLTKTMFLAKCDDLFTSSDLVLKNLRRAVDLVKNFQMIAVDQTNDEKRNINIHDYLADVVHAMTPKTSQKRIRVSLLGDRSLQVDIYPGAIAQLTTNLIDNAFTHAFAETYNGEINISYKKVADHLELTYQDNGIGMPAEILAKIFEPFYTTRRGKGGTGLGLSVVYNLVTQTLSGSITCQSQHHEWTRFIVTIPVE